MEIIPAIDIRGGRCVRLTRGDYAQETVYDDDPAAVARRFQEQGASRLHVVDLDGAREGRPLNREAIVSILGAVSLPVQVGGGIRELETVRDYLTLGVDRCVLGTAAVEDQATLRDALRLFPGRIAVAVDAREGRVATRGWLRETGLEATALVERLLSLGAQHIIYTDILRDGTLSRPNLPAVASLVAGLRRLAPQATLVYSGGIATLADLEELARLGLDGAIVGRALYTGDIDLRQALATVGRGRRP